MHGDGTFGKGGMQLWGPTMLWFACLALAYLERKKSVLHSCCMVETVEVCIFKDKMMAKLTTVKGNASQAG